MLEELLSKLPRQYQEPNLLVGNDTADDAAVYRLGLRVRRGELFCLLGPNGAARRRACR